MVEAGLKGLSNTQGVFKSILLFSRNKQTLISPKQEGKKKNKAGKKA